MVVFFYVFIIAENMLIGITKRDKDEEWISDTVLEEYECHRIVFVSTATAMLDKLREPWKDKTIFEKVMRYPWLPPVSGDYPNSQADVVTFRLSTKETCNPDENNLPLEIPPLGLCYFSTDERESNNAKKVPCVQVSVDGGPVHRINAVWHAIFVAWFRIRSVSGVPGEQELLPWEDQKSVGDVCLFPFALDMFEAMVFSIFFFFFFFFYRRTSGSDTKFSGLCGRCFSREILFSVCSESMEHTTNCRRSSLKGCAWRSVSCMSKLFM
jgi:hypothetical protein